MVRFTSARTRMISIDICVSAHPFLNVYSYLSATSSDAHCILDCLSALCFACAQSCSLISSFKRGLFSFFILVLVTKSELQSEFYVFAPRRQA